MLPEVVLPTCSRSKIQLILVHCLYGACKDLSWIGHGVKGGFLDNGRTFSVGKNATDGSIDSYRVKLDTWVYERPLGAQEAVALAIVASRIALFTKREVVQTRLARDFKERMGYHTNDRMKLIVAGGNNFPFSTQDIDNATIIWGRCTDEMRGKEVHRRKVPRDDPTSAHETERHLRKRYHGCRPSAM